MLTFSNDNNGKYPEKLEDLSKFDVNEADLTWLAENVEYVGSKVITSSPPDVVLAYDKKLLEEKYSQGTNVLYNDLHVAFEKTETLNKLGIIISKQVFDIESRILFVNEKFLTSIKDANFVVDVNHGSILNDDQRNLLLEMVRGSSDANLLTAPRVTVHDGEDAAITVVKEIAYISDYNESATEPTPKVENVRTGVKMTVLPKLLEKTDLITLALDFEYTDVEFEKKLYKEKYEYQIPNTNVTQILSRVTVADGQTVLLGGKKMKAEGDLDIVLIIVNAQKQKK